jgi:RNA ligase (TIGR02306 family)
MPYHLKLEDGSLVEVCPDQDVSALLGIVKFSPQVPSHMAGEVTNVHGHTLKFDIENIQNYPDVIHNGESVRFTEKCHGTFCALALDMTLDNEELLFGNMFAYSKGLGSQGLVFKNVANNTNNIYHSTLMNQQAMIKSLSWALDSTVHVLGEVFGPGVQDLTYGLTAKTFRVFDIYVGKPGQGRYLDPDELKALSTKFNFDLVPELYHGPFSREILLQHRDGLETLNQSHMREGVVIRPAIGRRDNSIGRVILKSVSPAYLLRRNKNATEYN